MGTAQMTGIDSTGAFWAFEVDCKLVASALVRATREVAKPICKRAECLHRPTRAIVRGIKFASQFWVAFGLV